MNLNALCAFNILPYIVDVVVVVIMLIFVLVCAKKGFITCLFGFLSTIIAIVAAFSLATLVADMTGGLFGLEKMLEESLTKSFSNIEGFDVVVNADADIKEMLLAGNISNVLVNLIAQNYVTIPEGYTLGMMAGEAVAKFATALITGIALFFVLKIVFAILKKMFNFIAKGGILGFLNKLLGAVVGFIEAVLLASVAVAILSMIPATMGLVSDSIILTTIDQINPIAWLLTLFLI